MCIGTDTSKSFLKRLCRLVGCMPSLLGGAPANEYPAWSPDEIERYFSDMTSGGFQSCSSICEVEKCQAPAGSARTKGSIGSKWKPRVCVP